MASERETVVSGRESERRELEEGLQGHGSDDSDSDRCSFDDGRYDVPCSDEDMKKILSDPDVIYHNLTNEENDKWFTYLKQELQSDGFDVDVFPLVPERIGGLLRQADLKDERTMKDLTNCAKYAISRHNAEKPDKLEFVDIIKANRGASNPYMFLITLNARVIGTLDIKIYQAHVECLSNKPRLFIFRPKRDQGWSINKPIEMLSPVYNQPGG